MLQEDQQQFLKSGLNACLGKPLKLDALAESIALVMGERQAFKSEKDREINPEPGDALVDKKQLNGGIEFLGKDAVLNMSRLFVDSTEILVKRLSDPKNTDPVQLGKYAHELKGSAASMGLISLYNLVAEIETLSLTGKNPESLRWLLAECHGQSIIALNKALRLE